MFRCTTIDKLRMADKIMRTSVVSSAVNMDKNKKLVSFRLPEELIQDLRDKADIDGISVTELVSRLLRQGLKEHTDNDRIANLEEEIRALRQSKQSGGIGMTPVYTLLSQGLVAHEKDAEMKERIDRLEILVEKMLSSNVVESSSSQPTYSTGQPSSIQSRSPKEGS